MFMKFNTKTGSRDSNCTFLLGTPTSGVEDLSVVDWTVGSYQGSYQIRTGRVLVRPGLIWLESGPDQDRRQDAWASPDCPGLKTGCSNSPNYSASPSMLCALKA